MKRIIAGMVILLICIAALFVSASATGSSGMSGDELNSRLEDAVQNSPELSSIIDSAENGNLVDGDALKKALGQLDGINLEQILSGLEGLGEGDGLLGKFSAILGPNSDGLAGIISGIGNGAGNIGGSGAANSSGGILENILNRFSGNNATTEAPTVHTTANSYNQQIQNPSVYTPNYNFNNSGAGNNVINYNQYTGTYTLPTQAAIGEVTTQAYVTPITSAVANNVAIAIPAGSEQQETKDSSGWKKAVGALLVFCSFAAIAAVVIKKSM